MPSRIGNRLYFIATELHRQEGRCEQLRKHPPTGCYRPSRALDEKSALQWIMMAKLEGKRVSETRFRIELTIQIEKVRFVFLALCSCFFLSLRRFREKQPQIRETDEREITATTTTTTTSLPVLFWSEFIET